MRLTNNEPRTESSGNYLALDWDAIGQRVHERTLEALAEHYTALKIAKSTDDGPALRIAVSDEE